MNQITLKQLEEIINKAVANLVTKDDAKNFATKDDLIAMEERLTKEIREVEVDVTVSADTNKAEKVDLERLEYRVDKIEQKLAH